MKETINDFDRLIEHVLLRNKIYQYHTYGYLDHDKINPRYSGIAMANERMGLDKYQDLNTRKILKRMTSNDKKIETLIYDFHDSVNLLRVAIGTALVYFERYIKKVGHPFDEHFETHYVSSIVKFVSLIEQVREIFIRSLHDDEAKIREIEKSKLSDPFRVLPKNRKNREEILYLCKEVLLFMKERNIYIHERASEMGAGVEKFCLKMIADKNYGVKGTKDIEKEIIQNKQQKKAALIKCYQLLIDFSNFVFIEVNNHNRNIFN